MLYHVREIYETHLHEALEASRITRKVDVDGANLESLLGTVMDSI